VRVWRIASATHATFDGEGARRYGSPWTPRGRPAVFTSATLSLAALERFVNTDADLEPVDLVTIAVDIEPNIAIDTVAIADLPTDWRVYPAPPALTMIGERWLRESKSAVLSVPSVVIPVERNFVLNPAHAARLVIKPSEPFRFDPRMWKKEYLSEAVNDELVRAIVDKCLVEFVYKTGRTRIVEPHDYGIQHGVERLLGFQISGESKSRAPHGWKWFDVDGMRQLRVLERHFAGSRADSAQHHRTWDTLFARVT
jgi:RES domain-containing protein